MSDADVPESESPGQDYLDQDNLAEDEEPVVPRDGNRPTDDDPTTSRDVGTAQTVTNDAVAGEPVRGAVAPDDIGVGQIEPLYAQNDLEDEVIDLDDTLEWGQLDSAPGAGTDVVDETEFETAADVDGPLSEYDALTDDQLSGADDDPNRVDITAHEGPDLNADDSADDGAGWR
jgi:hypothetical protein